MTKSKMFELILRKSCKKKINKKLFKSRSEAQNKSRQITKLEYKKLRIREKELRRN